MCSTTLLVRSHTGISLRKSRISSSETQLYLVAGFFMLFISDHEAVNPDLFGFLQIKEIVPCSSLRHVLPAGTPSRHESHPWAVWVDWMFLKSDWLILYTWSILASRGLFVLAKGRCPNSDYIFSCSHVGESRPSGFIAQMNRSRRVGAQRQESGHSLRDMADIADIADIPNVIVGRRTGPPAPRGGRRC